MSKKKMVLKKVLIGGCSSVGKTTVSKELSNCLGIQHFPLDKIRKRSNHPIFRKLDDEVIWDQEIEYLVDIIKQMSIQLESEIKKWCFSTRRGLLEGEGIEPKIVREIRNSEDLKAVYIIETDPESLHSTLLNRAEKYRKLTTVRQEKVILMNVEYAKFLKSEATCNKQPWVQSKPWSTLCKRILEVIV